MSEIAWLAGLQDGDQVIIEQKRGIGRFQDVSTVRLTPAYIVAHCPGQHRTYNFRRSDGSHVGRRGAVYERITLAPYDKDTHLRICVMHMKTRLEETLRSFSMDQINALSPAACGAVICAAAAFLLAMSQPHTEETTP